MVEKMGYISLEKFLEKVPNKYFGVVIASKEARRLNYIRYLQKKRAKEEGTEIPVETEKVTIKAMYALLNGDLDDKIEEYIEKTGINRDE